MQKTVKKKKSHPKERRKHTRMPLSFEAELQLPSNAVYRGKTKNMSFSGIYVYMTNVKDFSPGDQCRLTLFLDPQVSQKAISFDCQIIRTDESGIGIKFIDTDIHGYQEFKKIMTYNSPDPDKLIAELEKNPGLDIQK
jgi:hypothetical protein